MLDNILLLSWDNNLLSTPPLESELQQLLTSQAYMAYPNEDISLRVISEMYQLQKKILKNPISINKYNDDFLYSNSKAIKIESTNLLVVPLPHQQILGLIFDLQSNPLDYRNELIRLLNEYILAKFLQNSPADPEQNHLLLLTLFIDLRKYGADLIAYQEPENKIQTFNGIPMIKTFVYGLDNAGKSSLMRLLSTGKFDHDYFSPTKKFRITNLRLENSGGKIVFWDMPGQQVYRDDWLRGAQASNILLFILDSADQNRFEEAKKEFWRMVEMYELQSLPVLFLVNKIDLLDEHPTKKFIQHQFNLDSLNQDYYIMFTSLPDRIGIEALIEWFNSEADKLLLENGIL